MHITFVAIGWEQLSVSLLSAIAKQEGCTTSLSFSRSLFNDRYNFCNPALAAFFDDTNDIIASIEKENPDIVAFSPVTATYQWMLQVAQKVKQRTPKTKIVFGGVHVSAVPDRIWKNEFIDYVVVGEGDTAFRDIIRHVRDRVKTVRPLVNSMYRSFAGAIVNGPRDGFIADLDFLPQFDKSIWEPYMCFDDIYFTITSRGCPYKCTYCFNSFYSGLSGQAVAQFIRQRSPEHVMRELLAAKQRYRLKIIEFEDDVFSLNKTWLKALMERYKKEISVPFQCMTHPKFLDDETGRVLADAGCVYIQMGVQSMADEYKNKYLRRPETTEDIERALSVLRKYKIKVKVDHMFALPGEPAEAQENARQVYLRYRPFRIQTFWTIFLPGTEMLDSVVAQGLVTPEQKELILEGKDPDFFRNSSKLRDPRNVKMFKAYELYFKLIPVFPVAWLKRWHPDGLRNWPVMWLDMFIFLLDVFGGICKGNPDHVGYAKYYLKNIVRIVAERSRFINAKEAKKP